MPRNVKRHAVIQPQDESIKLIPLTRGKNSIVDASDYEWLMQWNWHAQTTPRGRHYAVRADGKGCVLMHREITGNIGDEVDHINGDPLDNRRVNLCPGTTAENQWNRKIGSNNNSGITGVHWNVRKRKWIATITRNKISMVGEFELKQQAGEAYLSFEKTLMEMYKIS